MQRLNTLGAQCHMQGSIQSVQLPASVDQALNISDSGARRRRMTQTAMHIAAGTFSYHDSSSDAASDPLELAPGVSLRGLVGLVDKAMARRRLSEQAARSRAGAHNASHSSLVTHVEAAVQGTADALRSVRSQMDHLLYVLLPALAATKRWAEDGLAEPCHFAIDTSPFCLDPEEVDHGSLRHLSQAVLADALSPGRALLQTGNSSCGVSVAAPVTTAVTSTASAGSIISASQPSTTCTGVAISSNVSCLSAAFNLYF